ncbi:MAG: glycosyltransferase family 4 protein [Lentisphaerae bacterium]|nr:glycosyltransferase family 4 protein [Lentisphaerota bacterium]
MNIWFLSPHEPPTAQTSRTHNFSLELTKKGHNVTIFVNSFMHRTHTDHLEKHEKWRVETLDGVRVVWLKTNPYKGNSWGRGLNMLWFACRAIQATKTLAEKPDIVVGDSVPLGAGWAAARLASQFNAAFVFQVRDVWPIALVYDRSLSRCSPIYFILRVLEKWNYRKADLVLATMPFLKDHVRDSGADPRKVGWVPNGVNLLNYPIDKSYDGGTNLPLIGMYVGGFGHAHDVITVIRAAALLKQKGCSSFKFILVGDGVKKDECIRETEKLGLSNIEFRDSVPKLEVPQLQSRADFFITTVLDSDAYKFGHNLNKIYDYFASGRPIILSGRIPNDNVQEAHAGFTVHPENPEAMAKAFEELLALTPEERKQMGLRAREYAEEYFDVVKLADQMEAYFAKIVKKA